MTTTFDHRLLQQCLDALVDDQITETQHAQLTAILKSSSEARAYYLQFIDLHFGLRRLEGFEFEPTPLSLQANRVRAEGDLSPSPQASTRSTRRFSKSVLGLAALAACLLLAMPGGFWTMQRMRWESPVVRGTSDSIAARDSHRSVVLAQAANATFFGELVPPANAALVSDHEYALVSGMIELRFPEGASTIIEAPAVFAIVDDTRLRLQAGQCSVHAPEGAQGFQVETPLADVVDLGTRFSIAVDEAGRTDVHVIEGMADVFDRSRPARVAESPVRLVDGQAVSYTDSGVDRSPLKDFDESQYRRSLPDRVVSYRATGTPESGVVDLVDLTVQRGGRTVVYSVDDLIGMELLHFKSADGKNSSPIAYQFDRDIPELDQLLGDRSLNTGLINPGGSVEPLRVDPVMASPELRDKLNTPGMGVRFKRGIVNDAGPDIVLFDLQTFTNPSRGDAFHVGPVHFETGLRSHTIREFDITMNSKEAKVLQTFGLLRFPERIGSLDQLILGEAAPSRVHMNFRAIAVGIDLSDLGYSPGATVDKIFIQDAMDDVNCFIDPVLIAGLPPLVAP